MQSNLTLKCKLIGSDELRRRTIPLVGGAMQTDQLKATITELFNLNQSQSTFKMYYRDDDDDLVILEGDDDVQEALKIVELAAPKPILRLEVRLLSETEQAELAMPEFAAVELESVNNESAFVMVAPDQLSPELRQAILASFAAEYVDDVEGAVGDYLTDADLSSLGLHGEWIVEHYYERRVRKAQDAGGVEAAVAEIALLDAEMQDADWAVPSGVAVPSEMRADILAALTREYVENIDGAVGIYFDSVENELEEALGRGADGMLERHLEQRVRQAGEDGGADAAAAEIAAIDAEDWSLTLPPRRSDSDSDSDSDSGSDSSSSSDSESDDEADHVWEGIWCDSCEMKPLCGARFMKQMQNDTYDLCAACFGNLSETEKAEFQPVELPVGAEAVAEVPIEEAPAPPLEINAGLQDASPFLDCTDLSASCIADIEAGFEQDQAAEVEAAHMAAEAEAIEAEAVRVAIEAEAAEVEAIEAEAVRMGAEAEAAHMTVEPASPVPVEWQSSIQALKDMGFASTVACHSIVEAQGDLEAALEAALNYVPPTPPAAALVTIKSEPVWEEAWDFVLSELEEMGFEDRQANKEVVAEKKGDLKSVVQTLVLRERAARAAK